MARAEWAAIFSGGYLATVFAWHRLRLRRKRREGPSLAALSRFDHRALWDELAQPEWKQPGARAPHADSAMAPSFYRESPWELPEPPGHRALRDQLFSGLNPAISREDPVATWLVAHAAVRRVLAGELDSAAQLAPLLPEASGEKLLIQLDLARSERAQAVRDSSAARGFALAALARGQGLQRRAPSAGLAYLAAHVRLSHLTHAVNLEISVLLAVAGLRRAVGRYGQAPWLHLGLARAQAMLGRHEEALDELGRALYHARADRFYAEAVLAGGFAQAQRPALAVRCREIMEAKGGGS